MAGLPFTDSEYLNRQKNVLDELPSESVLFIPTNPRAVRSNDVSYPFRASSYILYLCGWTEPDGIFVARKSSGNWKTILFVQPRDTKSEIWEGIRVGVEGASEGWPVDEAASIVDLEKEVRILIQGCTDIFTIEGSSPELDMILSDVDTSDAKSHIDGHRIVKSEMEIELMM